MRRELQSQGPRYVVQLGDKMIDYNNEFRLYITTRNTNVSLPPDAMAITTLVNFTTTRAGLTGQLLAATIQHEKPELESKKTELLKTEEDYKIQLSKLEDTLLEELASAKGNILENKELLESLNKTKESSATIEKSLEESLKLTDSLDKVVFYFILSYS
jgi:dynein heavy chain 2